MPESLASPPAPDDADFTLDIRVVEAAEPVAALMRSTSDNCGSSCPNACATNVANPS